MKKKFNNMEFIFKSRTLLVPSPTCSHIGSLGRVTNLPAEQDVPSLNAITSLLHSALVFSYPYGVIERVKVHTIIH